MDIGLGGMAQVISAMVWIVYVSNEITQRGSTFVCQKCGCRKLCINSFKNMLENIGECYV